MTKNLAKLAVAILLVGSVLLQVSEAQTNGVLLLSNGQVLEGKVSREGDHYYVAMPHGEIRLRACEVEFSCSTLDEAYRKQRSGIQGGSVHEHIKLCRWCVQHKLVDAAAGELANAMAIDSTHPMIKVLERRVELMTQPVAEPKDATKSKSTLVSNDELDRMVRAMPRGAVETFARLVQPVLLNGCTTAGCHGPGAKNGFSLMRVRPGMPPSRRLTQRNVHAVLEWIDKDKPIDSPLLTVPIRPHGNAKTAIFTERDLRRYKKLVDWVTYVAVADEPTEKKQNPTERVDVKNGFGFTESPAVDTKKKQNPTEAVDVKKGFEFKKSGPKRGKLPVGFVPTDPFDPEIFNRRFHKTK